MSASSYLQEQGFNDSFDNSYFDPKYYDPDAGNVYTHDDSFVQLNPYANRGKSFGSKISDWLGITDYEGAYSRWLSDRDKWYEREATNSARAWDLWMDSTATQRRVKDILAAGLNPWLALQSGGINANTSTSTAGSGSSARSHADKDNSGSSLKSLLGTIFIVAKLITML